MCELQHRRDWLSILRLPDWGFLMSGKSNTNVQRSTTNPHNVWWHSRINISLKCDGIVPALPLPIFQQAYWKRQLDKLQINNWKLGNAHVTSASVIYVNNSEALCWKNINGTPLPWLKYSLPRIGLFSVAHFPYPRLNGIFASQHRNS